MNYYIPLFEEFIFETNKRKDGRGTKYEKSRRFEGEKELWDDSSYNRYANRRGSSIGDDEEFDYGKLYKGKSHGSSRNIKNAGAIAINPDEYTQAQEEENWEEYQQRVVTKPVLTDLINKEQLDVLEDTIKVTDENGKSVNLTPAEILLIIATLGSILYFNDDGTISAAVSNIIDTINSIFAK